ncbi:hypothetical protein G7054_g11421 [Neopestalotiopsis clavispora]|nr:hypothetical protein G7054_g11421 [Neopestalotiopsis clavispora]
MAILSSRPIGTTVEQAPSHDGSPTYASYRTLPTPGNNNEKRPLFALRVYDTTAEAGSPDHVRRMAEAIYDRTWRHRSTVGRAAPDRIEVVGLPVVLNSDDEAITADHDEQLARRCRDHHAAEMTARKGARDWYLPGTFETDAYRYSIQVITRLGEGWENAIDYAGPLTQLRLEDPSDTKADPFGRFLTVSWGVGDDVEVESSDNPLPEIDVSPHQIASLAGCLREMRNRVEWFYNHYLPKGGLDREFEE